MKKHNFYAGPSILSQQVINNTIDAIRDFSGTGLSVLEISHRSKEFTAVIEEAKKLFIELLDIPEGYDVLFLGGGARIPHLTNAIASAVSVPTTVIDPLLPPAARGQEDTTVCALAIAGAMEGESI